MTQKKQPLRKCTGCGEMKEKRELIRVVKAPDTKDVLTLRVKSREEERIFATT